MLSFVKSGRHVCAIAPKLSSTVRGAFLLGLVVTAARPAIAQVQIGLDSGALDNVICLHGTVLAVGTDETDCGSSTVIPWIQIGTNLDYAFFDGATGEAEFTAPVTFSDNVQMSGLQTLSGTTVLNSTVSFAGPLVTFNSPTSFQNPATFNGTTNFTAGMTTTNISNSGTINSANLNVTGSFTAAPGTTINLGGVNRIQGVAAGINPLDAVNVAQLNAATSGITNDITALETASATHTTQISAIETVNATQSSQITAIQAVNTTQASQITAIQALNTTQSNQIGALQAAQDLFEGQIDTLFDLRGRDRRDMKQGVASAMAMASAPMPSEPGRVAYAVNGATFRGQYAVGGSLTYRLPTAKPFAVNAGFSYAGNKNNGVRVGVAGEF